MNDPDFTEACRGISGPKITTLKRGTLLFRFASSETNGVQTTEENWFSSAWWMLKQDFDRIYQRGLGKNTGMSRERDEQLRGNAKNNLAVGSWSNADILARASLRGSMNAYIGPGLPVKDTALGTLLVPNRGIIQLYLCNMKELGGNLLARESFHQLNSSD